MCPLGRNLVAGLPILALLGALSGAPLIAVAKDRAVLIGVGQFAHPGLQQEALPGVELDLLMMQEATSLLGFADVIVLRNAEATLARVEQVIEATLIAGVGEQDRLLFYFTGHGVAVPDLSGDERRDHADEALVLYDSEPALTPAGEKTLRNVLLDDRLGEWLARIPSRQVLVLIDACQSGTATRAVFSGRLLGRVEGRPKFLQFFRFPSLENFWPDLSRQDFNYAALSAAQDDEPAIATEKGSLFTLGVYYALRAAAQLPQTLTLADLSEQAQRFIQLNHGRGRPHVPSLTGDADLARRPLRVLPLDGGGGPIWRALARIAAAGQALGVAVAAGDRAGPHAQPAYLADENLLITVELPQAGYLNVIAVDALDNPIVVFPNANHRDNAVGAARLVIPTADMGFDLPVAAPFGPTLVVALLTREPLDLYELGHIQYAAAGEPSPLRLLSPRGVYALQQQPPQRYWAAAQPIQTCASAQACP